ncbi:nuclear transport factor 2 family protein [Massilia aerilata]|uniref:Nuclear transport factor 2 family protein n=1 Tax=Massilia aerilata TaxID=453817 RepID=A0ABW0S2S6_9BURK
MNTEQNKQLVLEGYRKFQSGDIAGLLERFRDDAVWTSPDSEFIPFAGHFHGKQGIAQFFAKLNANVQATSFSVKELIAEGDKVVAIGDSSWHGHLTGRDYDLPWVHVFTLRDGMVERVDAYYDTAPPTAALQALRSAEADRPDLRQ